MCTTGSNGEPGEGKTAIRGDGGGGCGGDDDNNNIKLPEMLLGAHLQIMNLCI